MKRYSLIIALAALVLMSCSKERQASLDYADIDRVLEECRALYETSEEGSGLGEFVLGSKSIFCDAIEEAEYVRANADRQSALESYVEKLIIAKSTFLDSKVQPACLVFDGKGGYIDCGSSTRFYAPEMTFEIWIKFDSGSGSIFACEGYEGSVWDGFLLRIAESDPTAIDFCLVNNTWTSCVTETGVIERNKWAHVACTFNGTDANVYINGEHKGHLQIPQWTPVQDHVFKIGDLSFFSGRYFKGKLFDFRAWNVIRTPEEIRANYRKLLTGNEPGLVANWPLMLKSPDSVLDNTGTYSAQIHDLSWGTFDNEQFEL